MCGPQRQQQQKKKKEEREEERRGEVMSEMAPLHNFSEREQKESEGKWKARKEGVCNLYLRR